MVDYNKSTGTTGYMTIRDNGMTVEYWLYIPSSSFISEVPWAFTVNGRTEWRVFNRPEKQFGTNAPPIPVNHLFHTMSVTYSQTISFLIGDTNNTDIGGPTEHSVYITRGGTGAGASITEGTRLRKAIPYVNVNGVWKVAEPWSKIAGEWKQSI